MKAILVCCLLYIAPTVMGQCTPYVNQTMQMVPANGRSFRCGETPLGFQCETMTYPELTTDINDYPCFTLSDVQGRHIEVLVEPINPIAQIRTCIREDGFTETCSSGINNYCDRVQGTGTNINFRIFCLTGGCETSETLLWIRIVISPGERDEENWCLTRDQNTPSSLSEILQPVDQMFDFDQDSMDTNRGSFMVLKPFSIVTLLLLVGLLKLIFN